MLCAVQGWRSTEIVVVPFLASIVADAMNCALRLAIKRTIAHLARRAPEVKSVLLHLCGR